MLDILEDMRFKQGNTGLYRGFIGIKEKNMELPLIVTVRSAACICSSFTSHKT